MDVEDVREYAERSRRVVDAEEDLDEQNTKVKLIQPLIRLLGWDIYSGEVELEHPVQVGSKRARVDYALKVDGSPALFVEAKACRDDFTESDARQLRSYMRQAIDVEWGLLTNGRSFEVLTVPAGDRTRETTVVTFDLSELVATPRLVDVLTRESIGSGRSSGVAAAVARRDETGRRLREDREAVVADLRETVRSHLGGDVPVDVGRRCEEFVSDLETALEERRTPVDPTPAGNGGTSDRGPERQRDREPAAVEADGTARGEIGADGAGPVTNVPGPGNPDGGNDPGWIPAPETGVGIGTVERSAIDGDPGVTVTLVPVSVPGFEFDPDDAFRTPEIAGSPAFVAAHVDGPRGDVRYVGRVGEIGPAGDAGGGPSDRALSVGDRVVRFQPGSLRKLADPIPAGRRYPRSVRYTDLGSFVRATTTDDLL